jgi:hypothetical protein
VSKFQEDKVAELHGQIALYSGEVQRLVDKKQKRSPSGGNSNADSDGTARLGDGHDEENLGRPHNAEGYSSDEDEDDDDDDIERRFVELEEDLEVLIADVYDLGRFTHLNYTGFIKIVKVCQAIPYKPS